MEYLGRLHLKDDASFTPSSKTVLGLLRIGVHIRRTAGIYQLCNTHMLVHWGEVKGTNIVFHQLVSEVFDIEFMKTCVERSAGYYWLSNQSG